jgi:hypothetical protein
MLEAFGTAVFAIAFLSFWLIAMTRAMSGLRED